MTAMIGDAGPPGRPPLGAPDPAVPTRLPTSARAGAGGTAIPFEEFVAARSTALLRTAYLLTRDHGRAEDLLQTALAKCWPAWSRLDGDPEPYVRRTLVTTYTSWWRRRWTGELPHADLPDPGAGRSSTSAHHSADHPDGAATRTDLWAAVGRLPRRQRATIVLRFLEDLSERETADLLGVSVGTVKSQTAKALASLRIDPALVPSEDQP